MKEGAVFFDAPVCFQRKDRTRERPVNGTYNAPCPPCANDAVNLRRLSITKGKADACGVRLPKIENKKGGMKYMKLVSLIVHAIIILLPLVAFNRIFELIGEGVKGFTMQTQDVLPRISHPDGYLFEPQAVDVSERQEDGIA